MAGSEDAHPIRRRILLAALFLGILAVMMRPSWYSLTHQVADLGDPVLFGWSWNWERSTLFSDPANLFDGNIFWRHQLTIAYTDNMLLLLAPFSVLRALGAGWALQLNALSLGALLGSLVATYSLGRRLTGRIDAAVFAAVAFTFGSFTMAHQGHVQLLLLGQFPLGFLVAFRWLERRRIRDAIWFGVVNVTFFLGSLYFAAIWTVCVAVVLIGYLIAVRMRPGAQFWKGVAVVAGVSALAIPVMLPYLELSEERPLVPEWGLKPRDLAIVPIGSFLYPALDEWGARSVDRGEHAFFLGFSTDVLAVVGLGALMVAGLTKRGRAREPSHFSPDRRRELWLLSFAGGVAFLLSLGPVVRGYTMPFAWFHDHVPGFAGIRVAARLAVPGLLTTAVLAGVGLSVVLRRFRTRVASIVAAAFLIVLMAELAAPIARVNLPDDAKTLAVYRALVDRPTGAVVELPMQNPVVDGGAWARIEAPRMLYSTLDLHPRINGYSGSWPADYLTRIDLFNRFPAPPALRAADRLDVRYVVLHLDPFAGYAQYTRAEIRRILGGLPRGATATRYGNAWLVDLGSL